MRKYLLLIAVIGLLFISGCDKNGIIEGLEIIDKYENVYMTIGFHPSEANITTEEELAKIIYEYSEEKFSRNIAKKICEYRKNDRSVCSGHFYIMII